MLRKFIFAIVLSAAVASGYYFGGRTSEVVMHSQDRYELLSRDGVSISAQSDEVEFSFALSSNGKDLLVGYVVEDVLETSYLIQMDNASVTIYDKNGDGIPDYRLFKNPETGQMVKEYPSIQWER